MPPPNRRQEIVTAAVELLDERGLDGLSMRALGERTGASATSVYWYVKGKDELVGMTLDAVIAEVDLPGIEELGWRECAAQMARGFRHMVLRHPWIGLVAASYPGVSGPALAAHNEHGLAVYEAAGFDGDDGDHAMGTVYAFVLGAAVGEAGVRAWRPKADGPDDQVSAAELDRAREAAEGMPRLLARIDALEDADPADVSADAFEFGLAAVLDGLEARR